jgi:lysozyme
MNIDLLKKDIILSEGFKLKPYKDTVGKLTIGVGRNLDDVGLIEEEVLFLLENDIKRIQKELDSIEEFSLLSETRQRVIAEMVFNLGKSNLMKFKNMWKAIQLQDWSKAANEMLDSLWAKQVGKRASRLATRMRTGLDIDPQQHL